MNSSISRGDSEISLAMSSKALNFSLEEFSEENIERTLKLVAASVAQTWSIELHRQTPDFDALRRLLDVRFGMLRDDVAS